MRPDEAVGTILAFLALVICVTISNASASPAPVEIFSVSPGDVAIYGKALPEEAVCVLVANSEHCTVANESGVFGVYPIAPLVAGDAIIAWGTYSPHGQATVSYKFYLQVVRNE